MDDFNSETDSDYTSYWRDWVGPSLCIHSFHNPAIANVCMELLLLP
jgi:hypothetical protein